MSNVIVCTCGDSECEKFLGWQEAEDTDYPHQPEKINESPWWWPFKSPHPGWKP